MELLIVIMMATVVVVLLYVLGRQTLIDWTGEEPTPGETVVFVILFMTANKALMDARDSHKKGKD